MARCCNDFSRTDLLRRAAAEAGVTAIGAPLRSSTRAAAGRPIANRSTVTSRLRSRTLTIRPSTVPMAHSTAAPTASSAATAAVGATDSGSGKATSQAPISAGTANTQ